MKIPESVRINGVEYAISYVDNLRMNNELAYGKIDFDSSTIELSNTDATEHQRRCITLLHEVLHGIVFHHGTQQGEIEDEERIVEMFSKGLYQFLQDNGARLFDLKGECDD